MRDVMAMTTLAIRAACRFDGIEGFPSRGITDGMKMNLESFGVENRYELIEIVGADHGQTARAILTEVGLEQRGRKIFHDAVLPDFDGRRSNLLAGVLVAQTQHIG